MKRRVLAGVCALGVLFCAGTSEAAPSFWQRTLDPKTKRSAALVRSLGRMLDDAREAADDAETLQRFRLAAVAMAELAGAPALDDPVLLLLYGHLLLDADIARESEARELAEKLLERSGSSEHWLEREARVLVARASRVEAAPAISGITRALAVTWDAHTRSSLLRERADARMALGDVRGSLSDQRAALGVAERASDRALSRYGIALALERSADLPAALGELRLAEATRARLGRSELSLLEAHDVFTFRPFDVHYVLALTAMALAGHAGDTESTLVELERALAEWDRFEILAPADDPWLASARLHRRAVEQRRDEESTKRR